MGTTKSITPAFLSTSMSNWLPSPTSPSLCFNLTAEFSVQTWWRYSSTLYQLLDCNVLCMLYLLASYTLLLCPGLSQGLLCIACTLDHLVAPRPYQYCTLLLCCYDRWICAVFQPSLFQPWLEFPDISHFPLLVIVHAMRSSHDESSCSWSGLCCLRYSHSTVSLQVIFLMYSIIYFILDSGSDAH